MRTAPLLLLATLALTAGAPGRAGADVPPAEARLGVAVDLGVPSGASVSLAFRPIPALRVFAGPAWNLVSWGVQGGVVLVPWRLAIAPALGAEVGRYFGADLSRFVNVSSGAPAGTDPLLRDVGVTYAAAHLGVEMGARRGLALSLRAGLAYLSASAHGRAESGGSAAGGAEVALRDPRVRATAPVVKVGLLYLF